MKQKKMISMLIVMTMVCALICIPSKAYDSCDIVDSLQIVTTKQRGGESDEDYEERKYTSFEGNPTVTLTSTNDNPCGGDCGVYFFYVSVGLDSDFIRTTSRKWQLRLMEDDYRNIWGYGSDDDPVVDYTGNFHVNSSGLYRLTGFDRHPILDEYDEPVVIEDTSEVELYVKIHVDMIEGEEDQNIEPGFFKYNMWIE